MEVRAPSPRTRQRGHLQPAWFRPLSGSGAYALSAQPGLVRDEVYAKSVQALTAELERCRMLGLAYLVTHLGSHLGAGRQSGRQEDNRCLETALDGSRGQTVCFFWRTAPGPGAMSSSPRTIAAILDALAGEEQELGVCLDTCHLHAAGYDLGSSQALVNTTGTVSGCIRMDPPFGITSMTAGSLGSPSGPARAHRPGADWRRELFGAHSLTHPILSRLPMILETPQDSRKAG